MHNKKGGQVGTLLCCTVVVEHVIVTEVLYMNSIIKHCIRKTILRNNPGWKNQI